MTDANIIAELARIKALFQLRAVLIAMGVNPDNHSDTPKGPNA